MNFKPAIEAYERIIKNINDELEGELKGEDFIDPEYTVGETESLTDKIAAALKKHWAWLLAALAGAITIGDFASFVWPEMRVGDTLADEMEIVFASEFRRVTPKLAADYLKRYTASPVKLRGIRESAWIKSWSRELAEIMQLGRHDKIERLLLDAVNQNKTIEQLRMAIYDAGIRADFAQARRVALTEMLRAHSYAQQEAMMADKTCVGKRWKHNASGQPRYNHIAIDGQIVEKDQPFILPGEDGVTYLPMFPRDTNLPAGESVNCHCTMQPVYAADMPDEQGLGVIGNPFTYGYSGDIIDTDTGGRSLRIPELAASRVTRKIESREFSTKISHQQYLKHVEGSAQYEVYRAARSKRGEPPQSRLIISEERAQQVIEQKAGTGIVGVTQFGEMRPIESITADEVIGQYWDKSIGGYVDTHKAKIHYGKRFAHIVPSRGVKYD